MKAHGIHPTTPTIRDAPPPVKSKDPVKQNALKKRKLDQFSDGPNGPNDDDEGQANIKNELNAVAIKDEPVGPVMPYAAVDALQYPTLQDACNGAGVAGSYHPENTNVFGDFIQSGAFGQSSPFRQSLVEPPVNHHPGSDASAYGNYAMGGLSDGSHTENEVILIAD